MNVVFIQQKPDTGWLPTSEEKTEFEDFLEKKIDKKVIFLPQGCKANVQLIGNIEYFIIEQNSCFAHCSEEAQKKVVETIDKKTGMPALFLPPACSLETFFIHDEEEPEERLSQFDVVKKFIAPIDENITIEHIKRLLLDFNCAFDATRCLFANQALSEVVFANMVIWYNKYEGEDKKEIEKLIEEFKNKTRAYKDEDWRRKIENMKGWMTEDGKINY